MNARKPINVKDLVNPVEEIYLHNIPVSADLMNLPELYKKVFDYGEKSVPENAIKEEKFWHILSNASETVLLRPIDKEDANLEIRIYNTTPKLSKEALEKRSGEMMNITKQYLSKINM